MANMQMNKKTKRAKKSEEEVEPRCCYCQSPDLVQDGGYTVCRACGTMEQSLVFDSEDNHSVVSYGLYTKSGHFEKHLYKKLSGGDVEQLTIAQIDELIRMYDWIGCVRKKRTLSTAYVLNKLAEMKGYPRLMASSTVKETPSMQETWAHICTELEWPVRVPPRATGVSPPRVDLGK